MLGFVYLRVLAAQHSAWYLVGAQGVNTCESIPIAQGAVRRLIFLFPGPQDHIAEGRKEVNKSDKRTSLAKSTWEQRVNLSYLISVFMSY